MDKALTETLYSSCPIIYRNRDLSDSHRTMLMVWDFQCGSGWFDLLLGLSLSIEQIAHAKKRQGISENKLPLVNQVKEKFGGLRVYMKISSPEINELIMEAQRDSILICECCGQLGELVSHDGCVMTRCHKHIGQPAN